MYTERISSDTWVFFALLLFPSPVPLSDGCPGVTVTNDLLSVSQSARISSHLHNTDASCLTIYYGHAACKGKIRFVVSRLFEKN